jgi:subtilisin family serine protease
MFLKRLLLSALIAGTLLGTAFGEVRNLKGKKVYVPGEILVRLKEKASFDHRSRALASLGAAKVLHRPDFFKIKLRGDQDVLQAVVQMQKDPAVLSAQPNFCYYALACPAPTDSYYVTAGSNWSYVKVAAPAAWLQFSACPPGSSSVTVAVLDSGISRNHPDLLNVPLVGFNAIGAVNQEDVTCDYSAYGPSFTDSVGVTASMDDFGHGTFVAGIIAGQWSASNAESCGPGPGSTTGMAGVAPGITLLAVKVLDCTGFGTTDSIVAGTDFAVANGAKVLNFSLGSPGIGGMDPAEKLSLDLALAAGCVIVASAGNESGAPVDFPAAYPPVIAVGATDPNDQVTYYSNQGVGLDLVAPGGAVAPSFDPAQDILSAFLCPRSGPATEFDAGADPADNNFGSAAGTSASAPFVSAAAALVFSMNPTLTNVQVAQRIINNTDSLNGNRGWDAATGYGRLNINRALSNASPDLTTYLKTFNSPNPFRVDVDDKTNITLALTSAQPVELTIYDTSGEVVFHKNYTAAELNSDNSNPQFKSFYVTWNGLNGNLQKVKTGVYFYTVKVAGQVGRNKIVVFQGS